MGTHVAITSLFPFSLPIIIVNIVKDIFITENVIKYKVSIFYSCTGYHCVIQRENLINSF